MTISNKMGRNETQKTKTGKNRASSHRSLLSFLQPDKASLCSLAIALWGYQTQLFLVAFFIIVILEARHLVRQRWEISLSDLQEASKLSAALLAILFVVIITVKKSVFIYTLLQWLPVAGLPLLIAQTYGLRVSELLSDRFSDPYLRERNLPISTHHKRTPIDLHYVYFGVCMVAASATDSDHYVFYGVAAALSALLLWPLRPKRTQPVLWLLLFCLSVGLGFAGHHQLTQFQQKLEVQMIAMIGNMASGAVNPDGTATQMGSIGRLKLSNKIAFRLKVEDQPNEDRLGLVEPTFPLLLQEATYNQYSLGIWSADNSLFSDVPPGEEEGDWVLGPAAKQNSTITLSTDLERGEGILALPRGVSTLRQLPVKEMQRNQYGAVQVNAKGSAAYEVQFQSGVRTLDARPTGSDLLIPNVDKAAVESVLAQLALDGKSEQEKINAIAAHFQDFRYSLDLLQPADDSGAVSDFLLNTKAGHCEYFASAAALLLRAAGIPARYAVGYSAHEFSKLEGQYIVRSRDAHAWTLYYQGDGVASPAENRWRILDTTPPDWSAQEKAATSPVQSVFDVFSFLSFQLGYRIRQLGELGLKEILMIVIPLFCYLLWRSIQVFQGQKKNAVDSEETESGALRTGLDSELFEIEAMLREQGLERLPADSWLQWCDRLQNALPESQKAPLERILMLHYRYRFDPQGLSSDERQQLRVLSQQWMEDTKPQFSSLNEGKSLQSEASTVESLEK